MKVIEVVSEKPDIQLILTNEEACIVMALAGSIRGFGTVRNTTDTLYGELGRVLKKNYVAMTYFDGQLTPKEDK